MGYQFVHLEGYARKPDEKGRSTNFIFHEAARDPDASRHVENVKKPVLVFGIEIDALQRLHDTSVESSNITTKSGVTKKIRLDQKTLHTIVASHPYRMEEIRADPKKRNEAEFWEKLTIDWLHGQYGTDLMTVVRHEDEGYFHIHAFILPLSDPELMAAKLHPGAQAKKEIMSIGRANGGNLKSLGKLGDLAYKKAMREWQDSYYNAVAIPCGLTRIGPAKRRLSRSEWHAEKTQAQALKTTELRALNFRTRFATAFSSNLAALDEVQRKIEIAKMEAAELAAVHQKWMANWRTRFEIQNRHGEQHLSELQDKIAKISGFGGFLRGLWDGLQASKLKQKVAQEFHSKMAENYLDLDKAASQLSDEKKKRRELEIKFQNTEMQLLQTKFERDKMRALLPASKRKSHSINHGPSLK